MYASAIIKAIETVWDTERTGDAHELLGKAVRNMHTKSEKPYANFCAIIQGSGTGKSRAVDKLAESVVTIPVVLRPRDDKSGAFLWSISYAVVLTSQSRFPAW